MALVGAFGIALSGCGNGNGSSLPAGGNPNAVGGGNAAVAGNGGVAASKSTIVIDDGTVAKGAYSGFNSTVTDTQSATQYPGPAPTATPVGSATPAPSTDAGSHAVTFTGNASKAVILKYGTAVPSLSYQSGTIGNASFVDYSNITFYLGYTPGATSPGGTPTVSIELTNGATTSTYDVRVACTGTLAAAPSKFTCPLPAYGSATSNTTSNTAVNPGASGTFTPLGGTTLYIVLGYSLPTPTTSTGNALAIDTVLATP